MTEDGNEIITHNPDEFARVIAAADRLQKVGEKWVAGKPGNYFIESVSVVPQHLAWWRFRVWRHG